MSEVSVEQVREVFDSQEWVIVDEWTEESLEYSPRWSITAKTDDNIRVAIDQPSEDIKLNNIIIESEPIELSSVEEFESIKEIADGTPDVWVQTKSQDGIFTRAKNSPEADDMSDRELVERMVEKEVAFGVQLLVTKSTQDVNVERVPKFVSSIRAVKDEFSS